jgi:4a-hydroxytetrahydrobiopterin dehydratase
VSLRVEQTTPSAHPGWRRVDETLVRELAFRDFDEALAFVERVAAAGADHLRRPDMCILEFNRVRLTIRNPHRAGITEAERRLAAKVDAAIGAEPTAQAQAALTGVRSDL